MQNIFILSPNLDIVILQGFRKIMKALHAKEEDVHYLKPGDFKTKGKEWLKLFRLTHFDEDVTPYMHGVCYP